MVAWAVLMVALPHLPMVHTPCCSTSTSASPRSRMGRTVDGVLDLVMVMVVVGVKQHHQHQQEE